jgi:mannose-6-phosphate isomerase-like protein (cupin superfamily)
LEVELGDDPRQIWRMKTAALFLLLLVPGVVFAQEAPVVIRSAEVPAVTVSPGVILKELTGRTAPGTAHSDKCSVALFWLDPGCASAWSYNKEAEESFFILKGHGEVWTGGKAQAVEPGSFILVPPKLVRSVRASKGEALEFYAVTSPAWSKDDDVLTTAPAGAPK